MRGCERKSVRSENAFVCRMLVACLILVTLCLAGAQQDKKGPAKDPVNGHYAGTAKNRGGRRNHPVEAPRPKGQGFSHYASITALALTYDGSIRANILTAPLRSALS